MSLNIGEKNKLDKIKKKKDEQIKKEIRTECLAIAYVMISEGETRKADEAIRVYKRLEENNKWKKKNCLHYKEMDINCMVVKNIAGISL